MLKTYCGCFCTNMCLRKFIILISLGCAVLAVDHFNIETYSQNDKLIRRVRQTKQVAGAPPLKNIISAKEEELSTLNLYEKLNAKVNFTAPGRRISEVKCLEYVWKAKYLEQIDITEYGQKSIVGGRPAYYGEIPHIGAVGWRSASNNNEWVYKCGAALVSERFLLTAAHCSRTVRGDSSVSNPYPEIVRFGDIIAIRMYWQAASSGVNPSYSEYLPFKSTSFTFRPGIVQPIVKEVQIKRFIKHKNYKSPKRYYDIALIELVHGVPVDPVMRPACLWTNPDTSVLDELSISGWGVVDPVTMRTSDELQVAVVNRVSDEVCDEKLEFMQNRNWRGLADHQICAGVMRGGVDTCAGDSGGPLQVRMDLWSVESRMNWPMYYLVGVTSFGHDCARANTPGVYVKVSSFIDWIESIVWPDD